MKVDDNQINSIVDRVVDQLIGGNSIEKEELVPQKKKEVSLPLTPLSYNLKKNRGSFYSIEEAIEAAEKAFFEYKLTS